MPDNEKAVKEIVALSAAITAARKKLEKVEKDVSSASGDMHPSLPPKKQADAKAKFEKALKQSHQLMAEIDKMMTKRRDLGKAVGKEI
ncbi:MAG: hypothetical protein AAGB05_11280 [Pseudomonadota bacterium]